MSSAWAIIEDSSELLLVRRSFCVGRGGQWCPPGGTIRRHEHPAVACVREAFEETSLRISIIQKIATVETAHYFLCRLNSQRNALKLRERECINSCWVPPHQILDVGTIMDLRRLIPILKMAGLKAPGFPSSFKFSSNISHLIVPANPQKI